MSSKEEIEKERQAFLKDSHELYHQRGRIVRRLNGASSQGLKRFADALEVLSNDELDIIAKECERMAQEKMKAHDLVNLTCRCGTESNHESGWCGKCEDTSVFERQSDHEVGKNEEL